MIFDMAQAHILWLFDEGESGSTSPCSGAPLERARHHKAPPSIKIFVIKAGDVVEGVVVRGSLYRGLDGQDEMDEVLVLLMLARLAIGGRRELSYQAKPVTYVAVWLLRPTSHGSCQYLGLIQMRIELLSLSGSEVLRRAQVTNARSLSSRIWHTYDDSALALGNLCYRVGAVCRSGSRSLR